MLLPVGQGESDAVTVQFSYREPELSQCLAIERTPSVRPKANRATVRLARPAARAPGGALPSVS